MQLSGRKTRRPFTSIKTPIAVKRSITPSIATKPCFSKRLFHYLLCGEFVVQDFLTFQQLIHLEGSARITTGRLRSRLREEPRLY